MKKMTENLYKEKIKTLYGDIYLLVSPFIDMNTKVIIKCKQCGEEFTLLPNEFTRTRVQDRFKDGCSKCKVIAKTEELKNEVTELTQGKISIIHNDLINDTHELVDMKCNICNYEFKQSIHVLKSNLKKSKNIEKSFGCAVCSKKLKKTTEIFKKEVYNLVGSEYEVLGKYTDTSTYIKMKHCKCNNEYYVTPNDFLNGDNRCPKCAGNVQSNASKFIENYLIENNISFITEKKFKNCKYKKQLPFDFYFPEYNLLLEYDGDQHFKNSFTNNKKDSHLEQHKRDLIKNEYCLKNDINLIRIKYTTSIQKIKEILDKLFDIGLDSVDYKNYKLYVIDIEEDIVYNEKSYYKEFNK